MQVIGPQMFQRQRTFAAYEKLRSALARFSQLGARDRHAPVEAAKLALAAELARAVGYDGPARNMEERLASEIAIAVSIPARKRRKKRAVQDAAPEGGAAQGSDDFGSRRRRKPSEVEVVG